MFTWLFSNNTNSQKEQQQQEDNIKSSREDDRKRIRNRRKRERQKKKKRQQLKSSRIEEEEEEETSMYGALHTPPKDKPNVKTGSSTAPFDNTLPAQSYRMQDPLLSTTAPTTTAQRTGRPGLSQHMRNASDDNAVFYMSDERKQQHKERRRQQQLQRQSSQQRRLMMMHQAASRASVLTKLIPEEQSFRKPKREIGNSQRHLQQHHHDHHDSDEDNDNNDNRAQVVMNLREASCESNPTSGHSFLYSMLNPRSRQWQATLFKRFITMVIITDLLMFVVSTDERMFGTQHDFIFHTAEGIASVIFLLEYIARLYTITEKKRYQTGNALTGRLAFAITPPALIDLFATAPFFLELMTGWNLPTLTVLRTFRLFRILKTESYIRAMDAVYRVLYYNSEILSVAVLLCLFLTLVTAVLLYYLRPSDPDDAEDFQSIFATLYLSTLMLTGQGGPAGELPWYTKLVVLLTSVFSVAMFAIPASMLTWGFEAEAERCAKAARRRALAKQKKEQQAAGSPDTAASSTATTNPFYYSTSEDESDDGYSTDEEYFAIIAGEDIDDGGGDAAVKEDPEVTKMKQTFFQADSDGDGTLTMSEYLILSQKLLLEQHGITSVKNSGVGAANDKLVKRIELLEQQTAETNQKLDTILQLLLKQN